MNIAEFLEARIAEDEARAHLAERWADDGSEPHIRWVGQQGDSLVHRLGKAGLHIAAQTPARVLAECAAKRSIIESLTNTAAAHSKETHIGQKLVLAGMDTGLRLALNALVLPYRDHPDYHQVRA